MARGTVSKPIKVKVPRHHAPKLGPKVVSQIQAESSTKYSNDALDYAQSRELAMAIENASEWNSLLLTARAERGPQWDIGTQLYHVDTGSDLYYDATPLLSAVREKQKLEDQANGVDRKAELFAHARGPPSSIPPHMNSMPPHGRDGPPRHHGGPPPQHMPPGGGAGYPNYGGPPPNRPGGPGMNGMGGMPPGQFYPGQSPIGMNMMDHPGGMSPDMARRRQPPRGPQEGMGMDFERYPMR